MALNSSGNVEIEQMKFHMAWDGGWPISAYRWKAQDNYIEKRKKHH